MDKNDGSASLVRSDALLGSIRCSFVIALNALCQAATNCGIIGLNPTKREITEVIVDLRKAIAVIDNYKPNADLIGNVKLEKEVDHV
jgi:hypothetical protein